MGPARSFHLCAGWEELHGRRLGRNALDVAGEELGAFKAGGAVPGCGGAARSRCPANTECSLDVSSGSPGLVKVFQEVRQGFVCATTSPENTREPGLQLPSLLLCTWEAC